MSLLIEFNVGKMGYKFQNGGCKQKSMHDTNSPFAHTHGTHQVSDSSHLSNIDYTLIVKRGCDQTDKPNSICVEALIMCSN